MVGPVASRAVVVLNLRWTWVRFKDANPLHRCPAGLSLLGEERVGGCTKQCVQAGRQHFLLSAPGQCAEIDAEVLEDRVSIGR
jgi:hypothetical protein